MTAKGAPCVVSVAEHTGWAYVVCVAARGRVPAVIERRRPGLDPLRHVRRRAALIQPVVLRRQGGRSAAGEEFEDLTQGSLRRGRLRKRQVRPDLVPVPASLLGFDDVARFGQVADDAVRRPLGDPEVRSHVAQPSARIPSDAQQSTSMVAQEGPTQHIFDCSISILEMYCLYSISKVGWLVKTSADPSGMGLGRLQPPLGLQKNRHHEDLSPDHGRRRRGQAAARCARSQDHQI